MSRRKAKQIADLENENRNLKESNDYQQEKICKLEKALAGEHCTTKHCYECEHGITHEFGVVCELKCKCKDYNAVVDIK